MKGYKWLSPIKILGSILHVYNMNVPNIYLPVPKGDNVKLIGNWDDWKEENICLKENIPLHGLIPGFVYYYNFIVDGVAIVVENIETVEDDRGKIHNVIRIPGNLSLYRKAVEQIIEQYDLCKKRKRKLFRKFWKKSKVQKKMQRDKEEAMKFHEMFPNGSECRICLLRFPSHRLCKISCSCEFCYTCVEKYVMSCLEKSTPLPLLCPLRCTEWKVIDLDIPLIDENLKRLYMAECNNVILRSYEQSCTICHTNFHCHNSKETDVRCLHCKNLILRRCSTCHEIHPISVPCDVVREDNLQFQQYLQEISHMRCVCGRILTRIDGCPEVRCTCNRFVTVQRIS